MKCPNCGKTMMTVTGDVEAKYCESCKTFKNTGSKPLHIGIDKPVDAQNQVRNLTDEIDPDLHKKPEK